MTTQEPAHILKRVLGGHRGERHLVALQDYPDPDALSSGMAHRELSRAFEIKADLIYAGEVSHHQNQALVSGINLPLLHVRDRPQLENYQGVIFIDNQGGTNSYLVRMLRRARLPVLLVVDHHALQQVMRAEEQIIEMVGATATLYTEMLNSGILPDLVWDRANQLLSTALLVGILSDTQNLAYATDEDRHAAARLHARVDSGLLLQVLGTPPALETTELIRRASIRQIIRGGFSLAGLGYLDAAWRDAIPLAAEENLDNFGVHTAVVFGIVRDWRLRETIVGSLRTTRPDLDPDRMLKDAFGANYRGHFMGGGRSFAGGFEIEIGMSTREDTHEYQKVRWAYYERLLIERLTSIIEAIEGTGVENSHASDVAKGRHTLNSIPVYSSDSPIWTLLERPKDKRDGG